MISKHAISDFPSQTPGVPDAMWRRIRDVAVKGHGDAPRAERAAQKLAWILYGAPGSAPPAEPTRHEPATSGGAVRERGGEAVGAETPEGDAPACEGDSGADDVPPPEARPLLHLDARCVDLVSSAPGHYLLNERQVAGWFGVSPASVKRWRRRDRAFSSCWLRVGARAIRARKDSLVRWLEQRAAAREASL